jgi:hypothetical protein
MREHGKEIGLRECLVRYFDEHVSISIWNVEGIDNIWRAQERDHVCREEGVLGWGHGFEDRE